MEKISIKTGILGVPITAAYRSEYDKRLTRVWCSDGSKHLVTGYEHDGTGWVFESVVGHWEPNGELWFGPGVKEVITRPHYLGGK